MVYHDDQPEVRHGDAVITADGDLHVVLADSVWDLGTGLLMTDGNWLLDPVDEIGVSWRVLSREEIQARRFEFQTILIGAESEIFRCIASATERGDAEQRTAWMCNLCSVASWSRFHGLID